MKPPTPSTPQSRDIFGAEFNGTPSHHRVLKPPGGGSSDIFGTNSGGPQESNNARRVKNHLASNVFLSDEPSSTPNSSSATPAAGYNNASVATPAKQSGNDSFCRLFGPPSPPKSAVKPKSHKFQSNILPATATTQDGHETNGNTEHVNGDNTDGGHHDEHQPIVNGNSQPVMNGNRTNGNGNGNGNNGSNARARVPPGGFSSGLW